jgi:2-polyprenyl-6-methoxyphenol hydroxylase and related FAD-dependent oxidoreductases
MIWPIISRLADRMSAERVALMAEAAHVVPPIGAQGLNMSLADCAACSIWPGPRPSAWGSRPC